MRLAVIGAVIAIAVIAVVMLWVLTTNEKDLKEFADSLDKEKEGGE